MQKEFERTAMIFGSSALEKAHRSHVAVFGIGGVGGYVCEALARSGIGHFTLVDSDTVEITNCNRQIIATHETLGEFKTEVMKKRILSINPEAVVETRNCFFLPDNQGEFDFRDYSYVVDAVDTVTAKIALVMKAEEAGVPVISSMGTGNKKNPMGFLVADIYETEGDPLAKVMRHELRKRGVEHLKVVYSKEIPVSPKTGEEKNPDFPDRPARRSVPGSSAFVPSAAGLLIASEVFRDLTEEN